MGVSTSGVFGGSNSYLTIGNYTGNPAAFASSCWVYLNASQTSKCFFVNYNGGPGWATGINDTLANRLKFYLGSSTLTAATTLASTTWYHVVFNYDGATAAIYLNGSATPDGTLTSGVNYSGVSGANAIGSLGTGSQYTNGRLGGMGYWPRALTTAEIAALYNGGLGLAFADLSGSLLTSLGSYHDFLNASNLGLDSTANGRNYTNINVTQGAGPAPPAAPTWPTMTLLGCG